jgi:hypothetical protein
MAKRRDYRKSLDDMSPEERAEVAPGFIPSDDVKKPLSVKVAEEAVSLATPLDSIVEINKELEKEEPDYLKIGMLGGMEAIGLIPGIGSAAKTMVRKGADMARQTDNVLDAASSVPKVAKDIKPQMVNEDYDSLFLALDEAVNPTEWQKGAKELIKKGRVADPSIKTPELEDSTRMLLENKISREEHLANVDKYKPVNAWDALPREPSDKALVFALDTNKRSDGLFVLDDATAETLGVTPSSLSVGMRFNGRLDIPAYTNNDTWVVAGTSPAVKTADGKGVTTYAKAIHYVSDGDKPVKFLASEKMSSKIGTGEANKTGYATVSGVVGDLDAEAIRTKAAEYLNDPEWTQVGFDPRRQGGFYVRAGENKHVPIREASEVIQIGPLVLARNAKLDFEYQGYNEGGMAMDKQKNLVFKSSQGYALGGAVDAQMEAMLSEDVDPVSGNEVPTGALPEEVRDDIPAQLSEGEYVVPADVVRYFGVAFFEDLRNKAKAGWQEMEANGRVGGEPIGMEMGADDLPFDISELSIVDDGMPEQPEMAKGGMISGYALGGEVVANTNPYAEAITEEATGNIDTSLYEEMLAELPPEFLEAAMMDNTWQPNKEKEDVTETKTYTNAAGMTLVVRFVNGNPMSYIPPGYKEVGSTTEALTEQQRRQAEEAKKASEVSGPNDDGSNATPEATEVADLGKLGDFARDVIGSTVVGKIGLAVADALTGKDKDKEAEEEDTTEDTKATQPAETDVEEAPEAAPEAVPQTPEATQPDDTAEGEEGEEGDDNGDPAAGDVYGGPDGRGGIR